MRMILKGSIIALALFGLMVPSWATLTDIETNNSFTLRYESDNFDPYDPCEGVTPGGTWLNDLEYLDLGATSNNTLSGNILAGLNSQYSIRDYMGGSLLYQYTLASSHLSGTMSIDWYKAFDREVGSQCLHGAEISAYYDYETNEANLGLDWVQLYYEHGQSDFVPLDSYEVDGTGDEHPAYYSSTQGPWTPPGHTLETGHDMTWTDGPQDVHPEVNAWNGGVDFYMFLASFGTIQQASFSNNWWIQEVVIYDGLSWGYTGFCDPVPEPATVVLMSLGLIALVARRRVMCLQA